MPILTNLFIGTHVLQGGSGARFQPFYSQSQGGRPTKHKGRRLWAQRDLIMGIKKVGTSVARVCCKVHIGEAWFLKISWKCRTSRY